MEINKRKQLHDFLKAGRRPVFSFAYLEKMRALDTGFCLPGSVGVAALAIPVIAIHVHPKGLAYFGFGKKPPEEMNRRFRYLDNPDGDEVVQICLHMKQNRQLALNLDPASPLTRRYLDEVLEAGLFGFVFFCVLRKVFMASFDAPDSEERGWIDRNAKRAKRLRANDFERILMDSMMRDHFSGQSEKKYYRAEQGTVDECFLNPFAGTVPMDRVDEFIYCYPKCGRTQMSETIFKFDEMKLPVDLVNDLRRMNPWWEGRPMPPLPSTRRHLVEIMKVRMSKGLAPIIAVRGPRQIGKTVAQMHVISDLLAGGVPAFNILHVQFDELKGIESSDYKEPLLRIVDWYEQTILKATLNEAAHAGKKTYLVFDEVQNLDNWAPQLKMLVDHSTANVLITGSSALRIALGHDSLAGRITTIEANVLSLTEIAAFNGMDLGPPVWVDNGLAPLTDKIFWRDLKTHGRAIAAARDRVFKLFSDRGGYPLAHKLRELDWESIANQLNETIIKRVIQHDLRLGERGRTRDASLLEQLFRLSCRYIGQSPSYQLLAGEAQRALGAKVGALRIKHYQKFLGDTLLLRLIDPLEIRLKRSKGFPKICLADHALRAAWLQEYAPIAPDDLEKDPSSSPLAGRIAESVAGTVFCTIANLGVNYFPGRGEQPEIDYIVTVGAKRIPVEIKYQRKIDPYNDTVGLRTFMEKTANNAVFGILVTQTDVDNIDDPRIVAIPLSTLMLLR